MVVLMFPTTTAVCKVEDLYFYYWKTGGKKAKSCDVGALLLVILLHTSPGMKLPRL